MNEYKLAGLGPCESIAVSQISVLHVQSDFVSSRSLNQKFVVVTIQYE